LDELFVIVQLVSVAVALFSITPPPRNGAVFPLQVVLVIVTEALTTEPPVTDKAEPVLPERVLALTFNVAAPVLDAASTDTAPHVEEVFPAIVQ
jgi:hypothetical protein